MGVIYRILLHNSCPAILLHKSYDALVVAKTLCQCSPVPEHCMGRSAPSLTTWFTKEECANDHQLPNLALFLKLFIRAPFLAAFPRMMLSPELSGWRVT